MVEIKAIIRIDKLDTTLHAIREVPGTTGVTVSKVEGFGHEHPPRAETGGFGRVLMAKVEMVVARDIAPAVVKAIRTVASTGRPGDGKIFVTAIDEWFDVRDNAAVEHQS